MKANDEVGPGEATEFSVKSNHQKSSSSIKNAAKQKAKKIRDRTIPLSKKQKRSRWMPGKRYIVLLWIQSLFHPFFLLFRAIRHRVKEFRHDDNHQHHHYRHKSDELAEASDARMKITSNENELLIE